jgi:hypothetical protein
MGPRFATLRSHETASFGCMESPDISHTARFLGSFQSSAGNDRSRHQAEPLPGTDGLDLLDYEPKPTSLAVARREEDGPNQDPQPEE